MKSIRNIAFSALLAVGAFSMVTYTACNKDECKDVVCNNGGTCVSGTCNCATFYEGTNCDNQIRAKYYNTYKGNGTDSDGDTYTNWGLKFYKIGEDKTKLGLDILDNNNGSVVALTITLQTNTTFTVDQKIDGTTTFTGNGTFTSDANTATLSLSVNDSVDGTYVITFSNMTKQ